jgi:trimeric autotransporter adhesin
MGSYNRFYPTRKFRVFSQPITLSTLLFIVLGSTLHAITDTYNSSTSWTVPAGVSSVTVEAWGGGGNGAGAGSNGGGGGGGAYARSTLSTTPGTVYTLVVGGAASPTSVRIGAGTDLVRAAAGLTAGTQIGAAGGQEGNCVGSVKYSGGRGADGTSPGPFVSASGGGGGGSAFTNFPGDYLNPTTSALGGNGTGPGGAGGQSGAGAPGQSPGGGGGGSGFGSLVAEGARGRLLVTYEILLPEIAVLGNGIAIIDGDGSPSVTDHTDFGAVAVNGGTITRTFTIRNIGNAALNLTGNPLVSISGSGDFTISQPSFPVISAGSQNTFQVTYNPSTVGQHFATLSLSNSDADEGIYNFTITGLGIAPEIVVEQAGSSRVNRATVSFGGVALGENADLVFTVRNTGGENLILTSTPSVFFQGTQGGFSIAAQPMVETLGTGVSTNFTVRFTPSSAGLGSASIAIANNDSDESNFVIQLTATGLSPSNDTDSDGLNDVAELKLAALGFDWQLSQNALVTTYYAQASTAGLYTASQLQTLNPGTPMIARDPTNGRFRLTLDWRRTTDLSAGFLDFPAPSGSTVQIDPSGDVIFEFSDTSPAAFYRLQFD